MAKTLRGYIQAKDILFAVSYKRLDFYAFKEGKRFGAEVFDWVIEEKDPSKASLNLYYGFNKDTAIGAAQGAFLFAKEYTE